jgi:DNA replication protein DnaC
MTRKKLLPLWELPCADHAKVTSNLPFQEWTEILGSERLTGALLDRLTHHVHILEMNGDSYRLRQSRHKRGAANP